MTTPNAAVPRDLETRLRTVERALQALTSAALYRRQLNVTEGDFAVSGGGDVRVRDGGAIVAEYDNGDEAVYFGSLDEGAATAGVAVEEGTYGLLVITPDDAGSVKPILYAGNSPVAGPSATAVQVGATGSPVAAWSVDADNTSVDVGGTAFNAAETWLAVGAQSEGGDVAVIVLDTDGVQMVGQGQFLNVDSNGTTVSALGTSSGANVHMTPGGRLMLVGSRLELKQDIEDADWETEALLQLRPVTWRDVGQVEADPTTEERHAGFIAEEVHALGLTELVTYDEDGNPTSVEYDRLTAPLVRLAQRQQQALEALTARVEALEAS